MFINEIASESVVELQVKNKEGKEINLMTTVENRTISFPSLFLTCISTIDSLAISLINISNSPKKGSS